MSYLLDKRIKIKKIKKIILLVIFLFFIFIFRISIFKGLSSSVLFISHPFLVLGKNIGNGLDNLGHYFVFKKNISLENEVLRMRLEESEAKMTNYNSILDENHKMKEIMERSIKEKNFILGVILTKPNQSLYDTLIIDVGNDLGIVSGQKVFALGNIPIGYIAETYTNSSKVILYSSPGEKTDVIISPGHSLTGETGKDIFMQIIGRGGGNFEMILPRDLILEPDAEIILPGINPLVIAKVQKIISNEHDSYQKVLLTTPVNIFELKFVEVEK